MDSYKRGKQNLQDAKAESHVLLSHENFVLSSILKSQYMELDFSTKFLTYGRYLPCYTQCSYPVNYNTAISTLEHYLPIIYQSHTRTQTPIHFQKLQQNYQRTQTLPTFL
jgi:hypothetical protein